MIHQCDQCRNQKRRILMYPDRLCRMHPKRVSGLKECSEVRGTEDFCVDYEARLTAKDMCLALFVKLWRLVRS